jgi:hypothetical protein
MLKISLYGEGFSLYGEHKSYRIMKTRPQNTQRGMPGAMTQTLNLIRSR